MLLQEAGAQRHGHARSQRALRVIGEADRHAGKCAAQRRDPREIGILRRGRILRGADQENRRIALESAHRIQRLMRLREIGHPAGENQRQPAARVTPQQR